MKKSQLINGLKKIKRILKQQILRIWYNKYGSLKRLIQNIFAYENYKLKIMLS